MSTCPVEGLPLVPLAAPHHPLRPDHHHDGGDDDDDGGDDDDDCSGDDDDTLTHLGPVMIMMMI